MFINCTGYYEFAELTAFKNGERIRITGVGESNKIYKIKKIRITRKGGILYLLKSLEENSVLRIYYEDKRLFLERVDEKNSYSTYFHKFEPKV